MSGLPLKRVKTIMKTSDGVDQVSKDAVQIVAKAAEQLIQTLTTEAYETSNNAKKLQYDHLVNVIHENPRYEFLEIIIPKKITVKEFLAKKAELEKQLKEVCSSDSESEDGEASFSEEEKIQLKNFEQRLITTRTLEQIKKMEMKQRRGNSQQLQNMEYYE